jgi:hypothetical protein
MADELRIIELENKIQNLEDMIFRVVNFLSIGADRITHYDFVMDAIVRRQLELDYILMEKTPASDFNTYCQHAFFQIENLLNYYFTKRFPTNTQEAKEYFTQNQKATEEKNTRGFRVSEVPYNTKFISFAKEFLMDEKGKPTPLNNNIQNIAYVRHSSIHRNSIDIDSYESDILKKFEAIQNTKRTTQAEWDIFNKGVKITFKRNSSFTLVRKVILEFAEVIRPEIIKQQDKHLLSYPI